MATKFVYLLFLLQLSSFPANILAKVPAIFVFGDSSVDTGNNNGISTVLKSNFRPYGRDFEGGLPTGRFCNGRLATDFISEAFGIKPEIPAYLDPAFTMKDFATGVCFASAGTGYDNSTSAVLSVIPLWKELENFQDFRGKLIHYLGKERAIETLKEALYLISMGTNDFLENYYIFFRRSSQFSVQEYQDFLIEIGGNFIKEIYNLGARKISWGGIPPMGCLPLERSRNFMSGSGCVEDYNMVAMEFNSKIHIKMEKIIAELPGIKLVFSDVYGKMLEAIEKPFLYGFENVGVACCSTGIFEMGYLCNQNNPYTCADASKYVFWDAFHPTEKMNLILADNVMKTSLAQFL